MISTDEQVVLVDAQDTELGTMEKLEAHVQGKLHRAFSILIFNDQGEYLLQKRADHKYHSGGLWSNTVCSHPRPNESIKAAGKRRLLEEIGLNGEVEPTFFFEYRAELDNDLVEHELDHVLCGISNDKGVVNPEEVSELKFVDEQTLLNDMKSHPDNYTAWFKIIMFEHLEKIKAFKA